MNAFVAIIPIIIIRYGLLWLLNKEALNRASKFAPLIGRERTAYVVYQIATICIFLYMLMLEIRTDSDWFYIGLIVYFSGLIIYAVSITNYSKPKTNGLNLNGLYRVSRNPMYIAYFIYFLGCVLLTHSFILLVLLLVFQISAHWIIISEERWCVKKFGDEYISYMNIVRRYI